MREIKFCEECGKVLQDYYDAPWCMDCLDKFDAENDINYDDLEEFDDLEGFDIEQDEEY